MVEHLALIRVSSHQDDPNGKDNERIEREAAVAFQIQASFDM